MTSPHFGEVLSRTLGLLAMDLSRPSYASCETTQAIRPDMTGLASMLADRGSTRVFSQEGGSPMNTYSRRAVPAALIGLTITAVAATRSIASNGTDVGALTLA